VKLTAKQRALLRHQIALKRLEAVQQADRARWEKAGGTKGAQYRYRRDKR
jgi:hypothetical protein